MKLAMYLLNDVLQISKYPLFLKIKLLKDAIKCSPTLFYTAKTNLMKNTYQRTNQEHQNTHIQLIIHQTQNQTSY